MRSPPRLVLVVVPDLAVREPLAEALRGGGFAVLALDDGDEARRVLDFVLPAAVVLDARLRAPTALSLLMELAFRSIPQPTVLVSSDGAADVLSATFAIDHVALPCAARALIAVVDRAIEEERAPRPTESTASLRATTVAPPLGRRSSR